jgi:hypothetical protein
LTSDAAGFLPRRQATTQRSALVADLMFVLLTIAGFVVLGLLVRAVERL